MVQAPPPQAFQPFHSNGDDVNNEVSNGKVTIDNDGTDNPDDTHVLTDGEEEESETGPDTEIGQSSSRQDDDDPETHPKTRQELAASSTEQSTKVATTSLANNVWDESPETNTDDTALPTTTNAFLEMETNDDDDNDDDDAPHKQNETHTIHLITDPYSRLHVVTIFLVVSLNGLLYGYDLSATSFVLQAWIDQGDERQEEEEESEDKELSWTHTVASSTVWIGLLLALSSIGAFLACSMFSCCHQYSLPSSLGRRTELQVAAVLYAIGAGLEASAVLVPSTSGLTILVTGRLLYGLGMGVSMHAAPTYLSEMSPAHIRGFLISLKEAVIVLGMVLGYSLGALWQSETHWPYVYAVATIPAILSLVGTAVIPESGRWLLWKGRIDEALLSIQYVYPDPHVAYRHFQHIQQSILQEEHELMGGDQSSINVATKRRRSNISSSSSDEASIAPSSISWMMDPHYRLPLRAGLGLVILQQITGQPTILSYAAQVLQDAGIPSSSVIYVGVVKLAATFIAVATVERFGRLALLYTGTGMMLIALVLLALAFHSPAAGLIEDAVSDMGFLSTLLDPQTIVMVAMFLYFGAFQIGFGPITWLIVGEIYPLAIRTQAVALSVQLNFLFNAIVQFGVPIVADLVGLATIFCCFALLTLFSLYFIRRNVPETKGLTLEEIEQQFESIRRH